MSVDPAKLPSSHPARPVVAICGGAVAGAEAAALCAERGMLTVVFEQNPRPYGKIEDGLPRWHVKLRKKEYEAIDANLSKPEVLYVPCTRLGRDLSFARLKDELGFSAVVMAHGAWRDRPLPVPGADRYVEKGLVYQNPLVYWFNHHVEADYDGPEYDIPDGTIVVGGGLASIDVVKIINLELYGRALRDRGLEPDMVEMETKGIPKVLEKHGLEPGDLNIRGCTLFYRRRKQDMPLADVPGDASPEQRQKIETARTKIMDRVMRKYLVGYRDLTSPVTPVVEGDRLAGLVFRRNEMRDGKLVAVEGSEHEVRAPLVVSSIGSIPEPIEGIPMKGELYAWRDWDQGELVEGVYGLGNVLTGKGNIKESRGSAQHIIERVVAGYLGVGEEGDAHAHEENAADPLHDAARERAAPIVDHAVGEGTVPPERIEKILEWIRGRWEAVGYDGDYRAWIRRVTPPDMR